MVGHLLNVVAIYLIYKAFIETSLSRPYDLLFHSLKQSESNLEKHASELTELNKRFEEDIIKREKAEQALAESSQLYKTIFDNSQDGFQLIQLIYDKTGRPVDHKFLKINKAYETIIGVKAELILDKTARSISPNCEPEWFVTP
jgi:PAS domain-containing protein